MLELKSSYEPIQETTYLRPVSSNKITSKPAGKSDSFNRILTKANQRSFNQKTAVKTESNKDLNSTPIQAGSAPTEQDQPVKIAVARSGHSDQQNEVSLEQGQPDKTSSEATNQETAQVDPSDENAEANTVSVNVLPQLLAAATEVPVLSSSDGCAASTDNVASTIPTANQMELPLNEGKLLTELPGWQTEDAHSTIAIIPSEAENVQEAAIPTDIANELKANEQDLDISKSAIQTQQVKADSALMQIAETETKPAAAEQTINTDLISQKTDMAATPSPTDSGAKSNSADGVLTLVAQTVETVPPNKVTGSKPNDSDLTEPISSSEDEKAAVNPEKSNKVTGQEDIRYKLMEKTIFNVSNKNEQDQPITDIKKLMAVESQRLTAAKTAPEANSLTETPLAHNQPETNQNVTGLEKMLYTSARAGLDSQAVTTQSVAPTVDQQDIIEQIVQKVELLNKASNTEMKIQLKPEFMGKMIIKIAVEDGLITARFTTESQQVKQLLEANMSSLKQNLEAQGLKVDRTEVNVQLDNGGSFHGDDSGREQMWQEYAERNSYNRSSYQSGVEYADSAGKAFEENEEAGSISAAPLIGDGKVDFMI